MLDAIKWAYDQGIIGLAILAANVWAVVLAVKSLRSTRNTLAAQQQSQVYAIGFELPTE